MNPRDFYDSLLNQITEEDEKKVFHVFTHRIGQRISREFLLQEVFGIIITDREYLNMDSHDRMIRKHIESLRLKGFPIVSTSSDAGYVMTDDPEQIDACIAEESNRILHLENKIQMLYRAKDNARSLHEWRETTLAAVQDPLF